MTAGVYVQSQTVCQKVSHLQDFKWTIQFHSYKTAGTWWDIDSVAFCLLTLILLLLFGTTKVCVIAQGTKTETTDGTHTQSFKQEIHNH